MCEEALWKLIHFAHGFDADEDLDEDIQKRCSRLHPLGKPGAGQIHVGVARGLARSTKPRSLRQAGLPANRPLREPTSGRSWSLS